MKNYYKILEIQENASPDIIRAAYKTLVKKYHPDNVMDKNEAKHMCEINEAYEVLSDEKKKREYDLLLSKEKIEEISADKISSKKSNTIVNAIKAVGRLMLNSMREAQKEFENAYIEGMEMNEVILISRYKKSSGYKRSGYVKALKERGFLEEDSNGKLKPTYKMRWYI